jgi:hypothetical protein
MVSVCHLVGFYLITGKIFKHLGKLLGVNVVPFIKYKLRYPSEVETAQTQSSLLFHGFIKTKYTHTNTHTHTHTHTQNPRCIQSNLSH